MTDVKYHKRARELDITFTSGKTYRYSGVSPRVYADLVNAESKGEFFNDNIKGAYNFAELKGRRA